MGETTAASFMGRRRQRRFLSVVLFTADAVAVVAATLLATQVRWGSLGAAAVVEGSPRVVPYLQLAAILSATWLILFWWGHLYDLDRLGWGSQEFSRVVAAVTLGVVGFILVSYALKLQGFARLWTLLAWLFGVTFVWAVRLLFRVAVTGARRRGRLLRSTVIVGSNQEALDIAARLESNMSSGLAPVGYLACANGQSGVDELNGHIERLGSSADLEHVINGRQIDSVVIAVSAFSNESVARMIAALRLLDVDVNLSAGLLDVTTRRVLVREASGVPLILIKGVSFSRVNLAVKRVFDLLVASAVALIGTPLWIALSAGVKLSSPGPVLFKQARTGRRGKEFMMFKFRSMRADAPELHAQLAAEANEADGPIFKMKNDPRVTPIGRFMRKFSLDEFPQLLNVFKGEMSLVGPRPLPTYETKDLTPEQNRRHEVPPGLTGLWQVSGRSNLTFDEMAQLDLYYIENWSVPFDLSLLARTIPVVLLPEGAY